MKNQAIVHSILPGLSGQNLKMMHTQATLRGNAGAVHHVR